jgi:hypothetical protein
MSIEMDILRAHAQFLGKHTCYLFHTQSGLGCIHEYMHIYAIIPLWWQVGGLDQKKNQGPQPGEPITTSAGNKIKEPTPPDHTNISKNRIKDFQK